MNSDQIRKAFIDFFTSKQHKLVPSSPIVPPDDPTLLFTTAGMVQFKPLYSTSGELPYTRACSVQKCMRAGGKGSDLENVGKTLRHHTFFEMLGNFSFGDYFKREAIQWAWEFSTQVIKLDPTRIYASAFEDDEEAWDIWTKEIGIPETRMVRLGVKDNFWGPAGDTGACGPCSELYYDRGEQFGPGLSFQDATINDDDPGSRYLEFWNCVFPQFDQRKDGSRPPLKNRGVDTGMGLERLCCIVQDKQSPFQIDSMLPVVQFVSDQLKLGNYTELPLEIQQAINVIADHVRALTFVLSEGILPGNEGRGYVMRRLLRRAARYARKIGQETPFMSSVVDIVVKMLGSTYPEISKNVNHIKEVIKSEEEAYLQTLGAGLVKLEQFMADSERNGKILSGSDIFQLTATFGLPLDDIIEIAEEKGYSVDTDNYKSYVEKHKEESRKGSKSNKFSDLQDELRKIYRETGKSEFIGYPLSPEDAVQLTQAAEELFSRGIEEFEAETSGKIVDIANDNSVIDADPSDYEDYNDEVDFEDNPDVEFAPDFESEIGKLLEYPILQVEGLEIVAILQDGKQVENAVTGSDIALILDSTPYYAESGGQVGDSGYLYSDECVIKVYDTQKTADDIIVHFCHIEKGNLNKNEFLNTDIDRERRLAIMRNHTATHILQGALKRVIGDHIAQQGSYVGPDYLRFDFTHSKSVSAEQLQEIESLVNYQISKNIVVGSQFLSIDEARTLPGIIAPFGEKYGQNVRVVDIPDWDIEFCGGTHLQATGEVGLFLIASESAVSSGVRRIEAITGQTAINQIQHDRNRLKKIADLLKSPKDKMEDKILSLQDDVKQLKRQLEQYQAKVASQNTDSALDSAPEINGVKVVTLSFNGVDAKILRETFDSFKSKQPQGLIAILASGVDDKVVLIAGATKDVTDKGISAGSILGQIAPIVGGRGGGKPEMAQAGGSDISKIQEALDAAINIVKEILK